MLLYASQVMSQERFWQEYFTAPLEWLDNRPFDERSPRSSAFKHMGSERVLWMEDYLNAPQIKGKLATMTQAQVQAGDGFNVVDVQHGSPGRFRSSNSKITKWMAALNQTIFFESGTSTMTASGKRAREGFNKSSSVTCGDVMGLCKPGKLKEALHILNRRGILADSNAYVGLLQECSKIKNLQMGKQVHAHIIQSGFQPNLFLLNTLVNMYAKCGSVVDARQVFDKMPVRGVFTYTIMIAGYVKHGCGREALEIYQQMIREGVTPNNVTFICVLKACSSLGALEKGKEVHGYLIKAGIASDVILETVLVDLYAKCGSVKYAREVFDNMAKRDTVSWNAMIAGYVQHKSGREAVKLYEQMQGEGVMPNRVTFISVLQACANLGSLEKGKKVHTDIVKAGIPQDIIMETALADMYAKCGSVKDARQVFNNITKQDVVSWSTMITGYAQHGFGREALEMYRQMIQEGLTPDKVTYICILNACARIGDLEKGKEVHADIVKALVPSYTNLDNTLVDMYAKCGSMKDAHGVFDNMAQCDVVSWNAMIAGYAQHGFGKEAFEMYEQMIQEGLTPDKVTFISILTACASLGALEKGKEVHTDIIKAGIASYVNLENTLVDMYAKCGSMKDACQVFDNMAERNVVSWNAMITGYTQHGCGKEALDTYEKMQLERVIPDRITFISVLNACASLGSLEKGKEAHADMIKAEIEPDIILQTSLADMYAKAGSMKDACRVFDNMAQRNVVSWNAMIAGYAQHGYGGEAFEMYEQMIREGVTPNEVTFTSSINACAILGSLEKGMAVHSEIIKAGIAPDVILKNTLVDMYAKCGSVKEARHVFDKMTKRNVVSWSAMIAGYAQHGCGREALQIFEQMQQKALKPDSVTFMGLLSACSHAGLVDEGCHFFDSMRRDHGITPTVEHFGCIVDLLGRAGRLDEAHYLINKMTIKPGVAVWGALLSASSIHGNVDVAELAAKRLLKLDPQDAATYVLLSNVYAAAGRWEDTAKVRKMMQGRAMRKE